MCKARCNRPRSRRRALTFPVGLHSKCDASRAEREGAHCLQHAGLGGGGKAERREKKLHPEK
eukprot:CAMPEP_0180198472 /NCGR_PEP_ID=MMETSP0987-20121128/5198_1 /TAXON_ID=697907 /ORGANISM="non described non described, Strain CCMP2293" /LENGTH=61 /DNA_ID=CAMNT_0022153501 /DNA_START=885 /DNA_END=1070 /DNA_ORIENTATION=-